MGRRSPWMRCSRITGQEQFEEGESGGQPHCAALAASGLAQVQPFTVRGNVEATSRARSAWVPRLGVACGALLQSAAPVLPSVAKLMVPAKPNDGSTW